MWQPILAYREFEEGPDKAVDETESMIKRHEKRADEIFLTVEGVHIGKLYRLSASRRASVKWLAKRGQGGLGVGEALKTGPFSEFGACYVLVNAKVEDDGLNISRRGKREIHAIVASESGARPEYSGRVHLNEFGVEDGTVFDI